jgi:hypothetical protein
MFSDTFAAALWKLNTILYTAGLNASSVQMMHMTDIQQSGAQVLNVSRSFFVVAFIASFGLLCF